MPQVVAQIPWGHNIVILEQIKDLEAREYYDLLLYHRFLRSLVVIDLKVGEFEPEMAGKMNFYLNVLDAQVKLPDENPTIGIILCKDKNHVVAEYALRGIGSLIGVAGYQLTQQLPQELQGVLPSVAELEEHLGVEEDRRINTLS